MDIASINKQALAQTYYILNNFDDNTKNKVPNSLFNTIKENMDKYYIDNPQNRARYRTETRYNQDEGFQKKHPIANAWYNIFKPVAGPTGGAVPINTQLPEMDYQDPRVQYEGMQYQVPGPVTDGLNLPRELAYNPTMDNARLLLNMENERTQANRLRNNIGRDVNKLQVPGLPEWYRNIVRNDARAMEQRIRDLGEQQ